MLQLNLLVRRESLIMCTPEIFSCLYSPFAAFNSKINMNGLCLAESLRLELNEMQLSFRTKSNKGDENILKTYSAKRSRIQMECGASQLVLVLLWQRAESDCASEDRTS